MTKKKAAKKKPANRQTTGMRGVYLVAAELSRIGFIVSPTSRSAQGADLLVTDQNCRRTFSVQVKTDSRGSNFLISKNANKVVSKSHIYVLVRIRKLKKLISDENKEGEIIEYYVVPSKILSESTGHYENFSSSIQRKYIEEYRDEWKCFGDPHE